VIRFEVGSDRQIGAAASGLRSLTWFLTEIEIIRLVQAESGARLVIWFHSRSRYLKREPPVSEVISATALPLAESVTRFVNPA